MQFSPLLNSIYMKKICLLLFIVLISSSGYAQVASVKDTSWKKGGLCSLNFNQVSFNNWAAGGENAVSGNALLNVFINYQKDKWKWDNTIDLAIGAGKIGDVRDFRKSDDKIDIQLKPGRSLKNDLWLTYLFQFNSQFTEGFIYNDDDQTRTRISHFMAPAYIINSIGLDYKKGEAFSIYASPLTVKTTIVNDELLSAAGQFGVDPGEKIRNEFGAYITARVQHKLMENVTLTSKLDLFSNYGDNPQNIDVLWDALFAFKINKLLAATINFTVKYDDDELVPKETGDTFYRGKGTQFREATGVGLSYKF